MQFTVRDALKLDSLKEATIIAGHEGLDNPIRFVNVMEVPDISDWISEYEMILTTAYPFRNEDNSWNKLIEELKIKKLSAFALKTNRYITQIPDALIVMGNQLNVPIIELPSHTRFDLVIADIMREIANIDYAIIKKSERIHRDFSEIILSGGGLDEIVDTLSKLTSSMVAIHDKDNNILAASSNYKSKKDIDLMESKEEKRSITIYERISAHIRLISLDKEFEEIDIISLERARDAVAIVLLKRQAEQEVERRYKNDFLNDVVQGVFRSKESLIERGNFFNVDLSNSYLLFLIEIDKPDRIFSAEFEKRKVYAHNILTDLFNVVFNSFFSKEYKSIIWNRDKFIFVLYPFKKENIDNHRSITNLSINIANNIKSKVDLHVKEFSITIGVGKFYPDVLDINKSLNEAKEALRIGKIVWGINKVYHYDDVETYNILMRSGSKEELEMFVEQKIGKLIDYDKKRNAELVATLIELLDSNGNINIASKKMFLHPKTVSYRRDRIEKILDISLNNTEEKFSIYMALKIKALLL
ncbi:MAG: PucR family transcriptional regulator ligand-binding domain-containing protein [Ignavibacteria bacterium]|nr:PucR family transcriptional regulator ligand-binding domain-containing protein [Ignavibacteria bacterium]